MIRKTFIATLFLCNILTFAQSDKDVLLLYKNVLEKSDSLSSIGKISQIDSKNVLADAKSADKEYPEKYFKKSMEYFRNFGYNESAFLFYLGKMRTEDLNQSGGKEHYNLSEEYQVYLEEGLFIYLAKDAGNYARVLKMAKDHYDANDYSYISKTKGYKKLKDPNNYSQMIKALKEDKGKIQAELNAEREEMKNRIMPYFQMLKE
ncbi:MAG: hypothetical protein E2590_12615 [Chryseobacterium sp.]|nr:hypothetical protein [Chryseobacterium sp.]